MLKLPNLLLIAGTGRNTGKTTLACEVISKLSKYKTVTGIKVSPHFHGGTDGLKIITSTNQFNVYEEMSATSGKDSSKMLASGATQVFYIEVHDKFILEAFNTLHEHIPKNTAIVCESPALRKVITPGIFIIVDNINRQNKKQDVLQWINRADFFVEINKTEFKDVINTVRFTSSGWKTE